MIIGDSSTDGSGKDGGEIIHLPDPRRPPKDNEGRRMATMPRMSKLALVSLYAVLATATLSRWNVREVSNRLRDSAEGVERAQRGRRPRYFDEGEYYYDRHFLPPSRSLREPTFPIRTHVLTHGRPRTATTLLFNMAAASHFLYLLRNDARKIPNARLSYVQRRQSSTVLEDRTRPNIWKTHMSVDEFRSDNVVVFAAAESREDARRMRSELEAAGHIVAFVQDMDTVKEKGGLGELIRSYVKGYGLSERDEQKLNEYFAEWQVLRQCCGQQMSKRWRNDMMPEKFKSKRFDSHPKCATYDIDAVERRFMDTILYSEIERHPSMRPLNKPSLNDGVLNGTYCSSYNLLVRTEGLSIWGKPGGRPIRTRLDAAIKEQIILGRKNLRRKAHHLMKGGESEVKQKERMREMWHRPEREKREWLRAVLAARSGGGGKKTFEDYQIMPTEESEDAGDGSSDERPIRTMLDAAIEEQITLGRKNLRRKAHDLVREGGSEAMRKEIMKEIWQRPEREKREWLGAVLAARIGVDGKRTLKDYKIMPTEESEDAGDGGNDDKSDDAAEEADLVGSEDGEGESKTDQSVVEARSKLDGAVEPQIKHGRKNMRPEAYHLISHVESGDIAEEEDDDHGDDEGLVMSADKEDEGHYSFVANKVRGREGAAEAEALDGFDHTRAIFLISFGRQAEEGHLVERCVLSLRRRGAWNGHVVLLTDAPPERYRDMWEAGEGVIVMHPHEEHMSDQDGTPFEYTKANLSLKSKRMKTFIVDYVEMDERLRPVELVYYLDIDILAGNDLGAAFDELESKYGIIREKRNGGQSRLYFFTPLSKEWPLQGGTFIVERRSSTRCLYLWRKEIDEMTKSGRGRDQDGLRNIYHRIESKEEHKCQLVRMDNEHYISFPTPRTFKKITTMLEYDAMIHISNSVFAKRIDEEAQNEYIAGVLRLSEKEKRSGWYEAATVRPD